MDVPCLRWSSWRISENDNLDRSHIEDDCDGSSACNDRDEREDVETSEPMD